MNRLNDVPWTKIFIVLVVFPLLVSVCAGLLQLAAVLVDRAAPPDAPWKDGVATTLLIVGIGGGIVSSFVVCRKIWPQRGDHG